MSNRNTQGGGILLLVGWVLLTAIWYWYITIPVVIVLYLIWRITST